MIVDKIANWQRYPFDSAWNMAFTFLLSLTSESEEKRYELMGEDMFAQISVYDTCAPETTTYETHRKYVDIQTVLAGVERMEWAPKSNLWIKNPYDSARDAEFYQQLFPGPACVTAEPGTFVVFFPEDGHMPQLNPGSKSQQVKKVVIKIRKELLGCK
jgi:YhcH/YjgK/YiaL family protein